MRSIQKKKLQKCIQNESQLHKLQMYIYKYFMCRVKLEITSMGKLPLFLALSPGSLAHSRGGGAPWFQPFVHARNFLRKLGNHVILVFFRVMVICSDSDDEFSSALVLRIIYTDEGYSDWKLGRYDHVMIVLLYSVMLRDDVLIENNKYGCVIMQNN